MQQLRTFAERVQVRVVLLPFAEQVVITELQLTITYSRKRATFCSTFFRLFVFVRSPPWQTIAVKKISQKRWLACAPVAMSKYESNMSQYRSFPVEMHTRKQTVCVSLHRQH
jgi:hypothetical protein